MSKVLIKLGGAVITQKHQSPPQARQDVIARLALEIASGWKEEMQLAIVHGAGCFGHIPAHQYKMTASQEHPDKAKGAVIIRQYMHELNGLVMAELVKATLPAMPFQPSAAAVMNNKKLELFSIPILKCWMDRGLIPVLYGDVAVDRHTGIDILSGDQIIAFLARFLQPDLVILGTDVDGVFTADPKQNPQAMLIPEINHQNLNQVLQGLGGSQYIDVTGGMAQKIAELLSLTDLGMAIQIVNAQIPGRLQAALQQQLCPCTWIRK